MAGRGGDQNGGTGGLQSGETGPGEGEKGRFKMGMVEGEHVRQAEVAEPGRVPDDVGVHAGEGSQCERGGHPDQGERGQSESGGVSANGIQGTDGADVADRYDRLSTVRKPSRVHIGAGTVLIGVDETADSMFRIGVPEFKRLLGLLDIPVLIVGGKEYFSLYALEASLFALGMPTQIAEDPNVLSMHHQMAGVMYGALRREAIWKRVEQLAKDIKKERKSPKGRKRA